MNCPICDNEKLKEKIYTCHLKEYMNKKQKGYKCPNCLFISFPENTAKYMSVLSKNSFEKELRDSRNSNDQRPGREFYMVKMAVDILEKHDEEFSISFFGAGNNKDHVWIEKEYPKSIQKLVDLTNIQNSSKYENILEATQSDIVVASEVIEHFTDHSTHFENLIKLMSNDGIIICSTNIYDGSEIEQHIYPFVPGHTSYWSHPALIHIAKKHDLLLHIGTPLVSKTRGGPRKKYVIFCRSKKVYYNLSLYLCKNKFCPSEQ
jgi:hypothetical protein